MKLIITLFLCLSFLNACSSTQKLEGTDVAPAASAEVKTSKEKNNNTHMVIKVTHLVRPGRLLDGSKQYVVWITENEAAPQNIGALIVNKHLEGIYETNIPYEKFMVFVTAETDRYITAPSGPEVFRKLIK